MVDALVVPLEAPFLTGNTFSMIGIPTKALRLPIKGQGFGFKLGDLDQQAIAVKPEARLTDPACFPEEEHVDEDDANEQQAALEGTAADPARGPGPSR